MIELFLVFIATIITDWLWGVYIIHTAKKNAWRASTFGALITLIGPFITLTYIRNRYAIISMVLGAFIGTFISTKFSKKE